MVKKYLVLLSEQAKSDLELIYQHYMASADDLVAGQLLAQLDQAMTSLETEPHRGHTPRQLQGSGSNCLELLTKSFRLIYREIDKHVFILMVLHQKQSFQKALSNRLLH